MIKQLARTVLPQRLVTRLQRRPPDYYRSYSQEGEDMVLRRFFGDQQRGFYVDVGAHHPEIFSNTKHFYDRGWSGINIDAMPGSMEVFRRRRPRDINIEAAISDVPRALGFHIFNQPALNSFDADLSAKRDGTAGARLVRRLDIETQTLANILDRHLSERETINFLTVDVEGLDMNVLRSNNWEKYRPKVVLVEEMKVRSLADVDRSPIGTFFREKAYELAASTMHTLLFQRTTER